MHDPALQLRIDFDSGNIRTLESAFPYHQKSKLFQKLISFDSGDVFALMGRVLELAEIPFAGESEKVKAMMEQLVSQTYCNEGFSYTRKSDNILVCYNAMITDALIRLRYKNKDIVETGINWILKYQHFERGNVSQWKGKSTQKYGGCLKSTPCYVGLIKGVKALTSYNLEYKTRNAAIAQKLESGITRILNQQIYLKLTSNEPITSYIQEFTFPHSYKTNILEIMEILRLNKVPYSNHILPAFAYLKKKRHKDGSFRAVKGSNPLKNSWIYFDEPGKPGEWISYIANRILNTYSN
jgi:hypothetical protein